MLFLGIILGVTAGFLLAWWFAGKGSPPEPLFLQFLNSEKRSARLNRRLMLHEMHTKVNDLFQQVQRMDMELQELQKKVSLIGRKEKLTSKEPDRGSDRWTEILRLFKEGFSPDDIARRLKLGKGEVEFALSLESKPSRVIDLKG
jgi:regulator of replication initiation timing